MKKSENDSCLPQARVAVLERNTARLTGALCCEINSDIEFSTEKLETYCLSAWEPLIFDSLLVAGAVEYCDRVLKRSALGWGRDFELVIAVHEPDRWNHPDVGTPLADSLGFLTGDRWRLDFVTRRKPVTPPRQGHFQMPSGTMAVIPFSDGLDSRAVAGIMARQLGDGLIRVRLGSKPFEQPATGPRQPFTSVPYQVKPGARRFVETSARSRGFKFAMLSGLAAYLAGAGRIIVPESGQGALGPALVPVGHAYEDFRNHPLFTSRMEIFLKGLFRRSVRFEFPRLWYTKAETIAEYVADKGNPSPLDAWSCWQDSRQVSIGGRRRQCGICAACMLRRLSLHAAHIEERSDTYLWENLGASTFEAGAAAGFGKITEAQRQYAIAGTLHHDHLAVLAESPVDRRSLKRTAFLLANSLGLPEAEVGSKLQRLLRQHASEWKGFIEALCPTSFVRQWAAVA